MQAAQRYHDALFVDVHRDTALELAEADNVATRRLPADEWFYGEVTLESLDEAFDYVGARPGELFIDLGSGVGKAVLAAALARPFTACVGVELLPALSAVAEQKAAKLQVDRAAGQLPWLPNPDVQVALREGNFLVDLDLSRLPGTTTAVVYCFATCLQQQTVQTLAEKLATELPVGSRVMIISKQLPDNVLPRLAPLGRGWVDLRMAHNGEALTTFVYQRL